MAAANLSCFRSVLYVGQHSEGTKLLIRMFNSVSHYYHLGLAILSWSGLPASTVLLKYNSQELPCKTQVIAHHSCDQNLPSFQRKKPRVGGRHDYFFSLSSPYYSTHSLTLFQHTGLLLLLNYIKPKCKGLTAIFWGGTLRPSYSSPNSLLSFFFCRPITTWYIFNCWLILCFPVLEYKFHEGRNLCLCSMLYPLVFKTMPVT